MILSDDFWSLNKDFIVRAPLAAAERLTKTKTVTMDIGTIKTKSMETKIRVSNHQKVYFKVFFFSF